MERTVRFDATRVFVKDDNVYGEYRIDGIRRRFSTKLKATKSNVKAVEKNIYDIALEDFERKLENKNIVKFRDIADLAIKETRGTVTEETYRDNEKSKKYLNEHIGDMDITKVEAKHMVNFRDKKFLEIRAKDIQRNKSRQNPNVISQSRYNKTHGIANKIFEFAKLNGFITNNPMESVKRTSKRFTKPIVSNTKYYSREEVEKMTNSTSCSLYLSTLLYGYLNTGVRVGELLSLTWEDIDFVNDELTIVVFKKQNGAISPTFKQKRIIPLSSKFKQKLLEWRKVNKYKLVYPNMKTGNLIVNHHTQIIEKMFKPFLEEIGVPYKTLKAFRTTVASLAIESGKPIIFAQLLLGHADISTTQRFYIRSGLADKGMMKEMIEDLI